MSKIWKAIYFDGRTPTHRKVDVSTDISSVIIEFGDGTTLIWQHEDFLVRQDRSQGPLRLEYGEFPPEILELVDPEFREVLEKRLPKKPLGPQDRKETCLSKGTGSAFYF